MKPKIISVKEIKPRIAPPPSEPDYLFVEKHGFGGKPAPGEKKKSFFEWVYKLFGV